VQDDELRDRYERDGWVGPVRVTTPFDVAQMRAEVLAATPDPGEDSILCPHLLSPAAARLAADPALVDCVRHLLGSDRLVVWSSTLFRKEPGAVPFYWHQDALSWHVAPMTVASAWIALEPARVDNGCVRVVPGSHRQVYRRERKPGGVSSKTIDDPAFRPERQRPMELAPGEAFVFSPYLAHGSGDNASGESRWGMAVRYGTPDIEVDFDKFSVYASRPELWRIVDVDRLVAAEP
jgi:non-haem Fe2+, alpha-ketoglutarate-dependent halogenase